MRGERSSFGGGLLLCYIFEQWLLVNVAGERNNKKEKERLNRWRFCAYLLLAAAVTVVRLKEEERQCDAQ